jgi:hypothetical protein
MRIDLVNVSTVLGFPLSISILIDTEEPAVFRELLRTCPITDKLKSNRMCS